MISNNFNDEFCKSIKSLKIYYKLYYKIYYKLYLKYAINILKIITINFYNSIIVIILIKFETNLKTYN